MKNNFSRQRVRYRVPLGELKIVPVTAMKNNKKEDGWPFFSKRYFRYSLITYSLSSILSERPGKVNLYKPLEANGTDD